MKAFYIFLLMLSIILTGCQGTDSIKKVIYDAQVKQAKEKDAKVKASEAKEKERTKYIIFEDNFDDNRHNWKVADTRTSLRKISNGKYTVQRKKGKKHLEGITSIPLNEKGDFEIETVVQRVSGTNKYSFGLVFGGNADMTKMYLFGYNGEGKYLVDEVTFDPKSGKENWKHIIGWTKDNIIKVNSRNTLKIVKKGKNIDFFINGKHVGTAPHRCFFGNYMGFQTDSTMKIKADYLVVKQFTNPAPEISCTQAKGEKKGNKVIASCFKGDRESHFLKCGKDTVVDTQSNLMWTVPQKEYINYPDSVKWVDKQNSLYQYGFNDWRIPTDTELETILDSSYSDCFIHYPENSSLNAFYRHSKALGCQSSQKDRLGTWSSTSAGGSMKIKHFGKGYKTTASKDERLQVRMVRFGPLDPVMYQRSVESIPYLSDEDVQKKLRRAFTAYSVGMADQGKLLLDVVVKENAEEVYRGAIWNEMVIHKVPLIEASKLLQKLYATKKGSEAYWMDVIHVANLAGQPLLLLDAVNELQKLSDMDDVERQQLLSVYMAIGYGHSGDLEKAYGSLLLQSPFANQQAIYYLNRYGTVLMEDKKKLSSVMDVDEKILKSTYKKSQPQLLTHVITGQYLTVEKEGAPVEIKKKKSDFIDTFLD